MGQLLLVEMHTDNDRVVLNALLKFTQMVTRKDNVGVEPHDAVRSKGLTMGAHTHILIAMRRWGNKEQILIAGCNCLSTLFIYFFSSSYKFNQKMEDALEAILDLQAVDTILDAMRAFPNSEQLQMEAIAALKRLLSRNINKEGSPAHSAAVRFVCGGEQQQNGTMLFMKAMRKFEDNINLQELCCELFSNLSADPKLRESLRKAGLGSTLVASMEKLTKEELEPQQWRKTLLGRLF